MPKKIGIYIPVRYPNSGQNIFVLGDGYLPPGVQEELVSSFKQLDDVEVVENVDYKKAHVVNGKVWVEDVCLSDLDLYVWYASDKAITPCFGHDVLEALSKTVKVVPDPTSFCTGLDKFKAHTALKNAGCSVADFALFDYSSLDQAQKLVDEWGAVMLKPRLGNFGLGVTLVERSDQLRDIVHYVHELSGEASPDAGFLIERFFPNDPSSWVSVVVVDGKVNYGYRKKLSKFVSIGDNAFKVLDVGKIGGVVEICDVSEEQAIQAEMAAEALALPLVSFDMIDYKGTPIIVDENTYPGCYADLLADGGSSIAKGLFENAIKDLMI